jgi:hypothetical protein
MANKKSTRFFSVLFAGILSASSFAGMTHTVQHTADVIGVGKYDARVQSDLILNHGGGVNISGHFRTGLKQDLLDIEGFIGTGKTDFKIGALTQFNLLPDLPGQIALAFFGGAIYINDNYLELSQNKSMFALTLGTIGSKKFDASFGQVIPYGGFQIEALMKSSGNILPITLLAGAEWKITSTTPWKFYSELDLDVHDSNFQIGLGAAYSY